METRHLIRNQLLVISEFNKRFGMQAHVLHKQFDSRTFSLNCALHSIVNKIQFIIIAVVDIVTDQGDSYDSWVEQSIINCYILDYLQQ